MVPPMTKNVVLFLTGAAVAAIVIVFGIGLGLARPDKAGTPVTDGVIGSTLDLVSVIREADNRPNVFPVIGS